MDIYSFVFLEKSPKTTSKFHVLHYINITDYSLSFKCSEKVVFNDENDERKAKKEDN